MTETRLARFQRLMRRLAGLPEPDDVTPSAVMAWRTPIVEMVMLVPLLASVPWLAWTIGWDRPDFEVAPLLAGVFIITGWPWTRRPVPIRGLWPRRIAGVAAVWFCCLSAETIVGVGGHHDLASFLATAGGALLACYLFAASTRWPGPAADHARDE